MGRRTEPYELPRLERNGAGSYRLDGRVMTQYQVVAELRRRGFGRITIDEMIRAAR